MTSPQYNLSNMSPFHYDEDEFYFMENNQNSNINKYLRLEWEAERSRKNRLPKDAGDSSSFLSNYEVSDDPSIMMEEQ